MDYENNSTERCKVDINGNMKMTITKGKRLIIGKTSVFFTRKEFINQKTLECFFLNNNVKEIVDIGKTISVCYNSLVAGHTSRTSRTKKLLQPVSMR